MRTMTFGLISLLAGAAWSAPWIKGVTDKSPLDYTVGEDIVFTLTLEGGEPLPSGVKVLWSRTGDDGLSDKGEWDAKEPLVVKTKLARAGFVRLLAEAKTADGKPWNPGETKAPVFFDGGAAADVKAIRQSKPEPADFDAFWKKCLAELAAVPMKAETEEIASPTEGVRLYKVKIACADSTGQSTGYLSVPVAPGRYSATASFWGYGASWSKGAYQPPKKLPTDTVFFSITAHGYELNRDAGYYFDLRAKAKSNGFGHGFDPRQNASPETSYFKGMAMRVIRGVEYLKTRPEWNGKDLVVTGGSQGSLQSMWCAAFVPGVTFARINIPWMCNAGGVAEGRNHGDWYPAWAPGLDYFDQVNVAKRVPMTCRVEITRAGLGDYIAPPCGVALMYAALRCPKSVVWVQGSTHGYVPPSPQKIRW